MFFDDEIPKHKQPELFPRVLEGKSVEQLKEYRAELEAEILNINKEIEARKQVKAAAEKLFGADS